MKTLLTDMTKYELIQAGISRKYIETAGMNECGSDIAEYLVSIGFTGVNFYDTGRNGLVTTAEGLKISTNGFCYLPQGLIYQIATDTSYYGSAATDETVDAYEKFVENWMIEHGFADVLIERTYDHPIRSEIFSEDEPWAAFLNQ